MLHLNTHLEVATVEASCQPSLESHVPSQLRVHGPSQDAHTDVCTCARLCVMETHVRVCVAELY